MGDRKALGRLLKQLLNSCGYATESVYYQSPKNTLMTYPAIIYRKMRLESNYADDKRYLKNQPYEITVIDRIPDNPVCDLLLDVPFCEPSTSYIAEGLHHNKFTVYY